MWNQDILYFMKIWQEDNETDDQINTLLDGQEFVMFFVKNDNVYGAGEDGRLTFARMKNPDEEDTKDWAKEANFLVVNLSKSLKGHKVSNIFSQTDIKSIKVIDRGKAANLLKDQVEGELKAPKPKNEKPEQPMGTIQIKDKK